MHKRAFLLTGGIVVVLGIIVTFISVSKTKPVNLKESDAKDIKYNNSEKEFLSTLTTPLGKNNLTFSLVVPKTWRTTAQKGVNLPQRFTAYNDNLVVFNFLSTNVPHDGESNLTPVNHLGFYDVTDWIKTTTGKEDDFGGVKKSTDKSRVFNSLIEMRNKKQVDNYFDCKNILFGCQGKISTYVESSDGTLSGFANIQTSTQSYSYDPTVYVYMTGVIADKTVYAEGRFSLFDNFSKEIRRAIETNSNDHEAVNLVVKKALEQLNTGLLPDTKQQFDEVLNVVKSVKLERVIRAVE